MTHGVCAGAQRAESEDLLARLEPLGVRLGLKRARRLLVALGNPHLAVPVVLVAGTNGKGSTAALLAAICQAAGYRVGLYTSPHLEAVVERLSVGGTSIDDRQLACYLEQCIEVAAELGSEPPTRFEALTIAAFLHFRAAASDLAIMEVGLGGRLDATNVSSPELSIITSISLDHEHHLGDSPRSAAREKAGIMRRSRPVIAWPGEPDVVRVLRERAAAGGSNLVFADPAAASVSTPADAHPQRVRLKSARATYDLELFLPGQHQLANLSLAVQAAEVLSAQGWPAIDAAAITGGTARCRWPGRLEWIELDGRRRVLLDGAHNAAGLEALIAFLRRLDERPDLLFGALAEKTVDGVLPRLAAEVRRVVLTRLATKRSAAPERWFEHFEGKSVHIEADLGRALDAALAACEGTLVVCGSFFLVGRVRALLRRRFGVPPALGQVRTVR